MRRLALIVALCAVSHAAEAQGTAADKAVASQLFDDASKLMASGDVAQACPKFAESQRLDPQLGTLLHLAECLAQAGKTASAWVSFKDALDIATQRGDAREPRIRARIAELDKQLARLAIGVSESAPSDLEVKRDGESVGKAVFGTAVPVDPGVHEIEASAPGRVPFRTKVEVAAGATSTVAIPELAPAAAAAQASAAVPGAAPVLVAPSAAGASARIDTTTQTASPGRTQRILGWTAIAAGAIGVGVGIGFMVVRGSNLSKVDKTISDHCPDGPNNLSNPCDYGTNDSIAKYTNDARSAQTIAIVGFAAGGVLAATGITLLLIAPSGELAPNALRFTPVLASSYRGFSLSGSL